MLQTTLSLTWIQFLVPSPSRQLQVSHLHITTRTSEISPITTLITNCGHEYPSLALPNFRLDTTTQYRSNNGFVTLHPRFGCVIFQPRVASMFNRNALDGFHDISLDKFPYYTRLSVTLSIPMDTQLDMKKMQLGFTPHIMPDHPLLQCISAVMARSQDLQTRQHH